MKKLLFKLGAWMMGKRNAYTFEAGYNNYMILTDSPISESQSKAILSVIIKEFKDVKNEEGMSVYFRQDLVKMATRDTNNGIKKEGELVFDDEQDNSKIVIEDILQYMASDIKGIDQFKKDINK